MANGTFTITSGGRARKTLWKGPRTATRANIWLHGRSSAQADRASIMRDRITARGLHLFPAAEDHDGEILWQWPNGHGEEVGSADDVTFLQPSVLGVQIRRDFPKVKKIVLNGYSNGGGMVFHLRHHGFPDGQAYDGYGVCKNTFFDDELKPDGSWDTVDLKPFFYWFSKDDPQVQDHVPPHLLYTAAIAAMEKAYGAPTAVLTTPKLCDKTIELRKYGIIALRTIVELNAAHGWLNCAAGSIDAEADKFYDEFVGA